MFHDSILHGDEAKKTKTAFLWSRILDTPFWAIFNMLPFILYRDLHATPFQLAVILALKPVSSIFSMYWSSLIDQKRERLLPNIIWGGFLRHLPFLFFPFIDNCWIFIAIFGFHMMLSRGAQPAWIEILRINIPEVSREKTFAFGAALGHVGDAIFPFVLGSLLDGYFLAWKWIFPVTAALSLLSILLQRKIPIRLNSILKSDSNKIKPLKELIAQPWIAAWKLIKNRPDFARFQIAFMISGVGLMIMQPALTIFYVDELNLSYTQLAVALTAFKGIGFALTSPLWAKWFNKMNIYRFTCLVTVLLCIFPYFVILSQYNIAWLYLGYLGYGIMQAGSSLCWNMSGPIFAKEEDSSLYTSVNVVTVGLRGCIAPALGSALCAYADSTMVLVLGSLICLVAVERLLTYSNFAPGEMLQKIKL